MISIIYHSKSGTNKELAIKVYEYIENKNIEVYAIPVSEVDKNWKKINQSKGIIFGCPTYFGGISAEFKKFMEKSSVFFSQQNWKDKYAMAFTCSGTPSGDKLGTLTQLFLYACQHGMIWVSLGAGFTKGENDINRLGSWVGLMAQPNSENNISKVNLSDLKTAEFLAERMIQTISNYV